jgi:hypothetical protein
MSDEYKISRTAKIALILGLSPFILMFAVSLTIGFININFGNRECLIEKNFLEMDFKGTVIQKGLDQSQHNYRYIDIIDSNQVRQKIYLVENPHILWDRIEVNDIIIKNKDSLKFRIFRDGGVFVIEPKFDCGEKDFWITSKRFHI